MPVLLLQEITKDDIFEEYGYNVPLTNIEKMASYRSGTGTTGLRQTAFYCEVTDGMKVSPGGGIDIEFLEVFEMTIDKIKNIFVKMILNCCLFTVNFQIARVNLFLQYVMLRTFIKYLYLVKYPMFISSATKCTVYISTAETVILPESPGGFFTFFSF